MRAAIILAAFTCLSAPAYAWQEPKQISPISPVCTVAYDPNEGVQINLPPGNNLTLDFGENRQDITVAASDTVHLSYVPRGSMLFLKAQMQMPPQSLMVTTQRKDGGKVEAFAFELATPEGAKRRCDLIRFIFPSDAADERRVEAAKRREEWQAAQATRDLRNASRLPTAASTVNRGYTISGDASLVPRQIAPSTGTAAIQVGGR
ncbi:MAG: virB9 [Rhodoferax sp.]|nr:virB9 [Rhodoferax sp.]